MDQNEVELRRIYARRPAPPDFTAGVMEQVRAGRRVRKFPFRRWGIVGAVAASLTVGIYVRQQRQSEARLLQSVQAQQAGDDLLLSLQMAGEKINKAREAVVRFPGGGSSQ